MQRCLEDGSNLRGREVQLDASREAMRIYAQPAPPAAHLEGASHAAAAQVRARTQLSATGA
jgi:hypothetical protein